MNFEDYVKDEFSKGDKKFTKLETKIDDIRVELRDIHIALQVDEKLRAAKTRNIAIISGGLMSIITGAILHILKGAL